MIGPIIDISIEQVKKTFDANVFGALRTARAVIPHMASRKQGIIVNVGSIVGEVCVLPLRCPALSPAKPISDYDVLCLIFVGSYRRLADTLQTDAVERDLLFYKSRASHNHRGPADGMQTSRSLRRPPCPGFRQVQPSR